MPPWLLLLAPDANARPAEVPPPNRLDAWEAPLRGDAAGTRAAMIVETRDARPVRLEVWQGERWVEARQTWRSGRVAVHVADLGRAARELRFKSPDRARIVLLDWDLFEPQREPRSDRAPVSTGVLPDALVAIGVTARADWGARATTCTSLENDWYRMAIHHTAGTQTYGGTVKGAVQALQAYAMDGGEYCDIPYQYLVGYDGSLWEGRPYGYYSGATNANNDGNVAVCFLGCYHPESGCPTSHEVTDAMMDGGQLLVQTLVALHDIPSDADSIRGHRDWPDNATSCPGDYLYARLDELREPLGPDYAGLFSSQSFPAASEGAVELTLGQEVAGYIELTNTGSATWEPGSTNLGTIPRDEPSVLADETWISTTRPATVDASTPPGEVGRFSFVLQGNAVGETTQSFGLVQEWVTWFADDGGPADGTLQVRVVVSAPPEAPDSGASTDSADTDAEPGGTTPDPGSVAGGGAPGALVPMEGVGCGCSTAGGPAAATGLAVLGVLASARRRRRVASAALADRE